MPMAVLRRVVNEAYTNVSSGALLLTALLLSATGESLAKLPAATDEQKAASDKQGDLDKAQLLSASNYQVGAWQTAVPLWSMEMPPMEHATV